MPLHRQPTQPTTVSKILTCQTHMLAPLRKRANKSHVGEPLVTNTAITVKKGKPSCLRLYSKLPLWVLFVRHDALKTAGTKCRGHVLDTAQTYLTD